MYSYAFDRDVIKDKKLQPTGVVTQNDDPSPPVVHKRDYPYALRAQLSDFTALLLARIAARVKPSTSLHHRCVVASRSCPSPFVLLAFSAHDASMQHYRNFSQASQQQRSPHATQARRGPGT
jgi:hypothetical protein